MKKMSHFVWCKVSMPLLICILPVFTFAQSNIEQVLLEEIAETELRVTNEQRNRLENVKRNPIYKRVQAIKVGNIKALQNRSRLPITIPGRQELFTARVDRLEAISEEEFVWNGIIEEEKGTVLIIAKNGAIYGQINIGNEIYEIHDLGKQQNILVQINETIYTEAECATENPSEIELNEREPLIQPRHHCNVLVRVLVLYTDAAAQVVNPPYHADLLINQTNTALRNSGIGVQDLTFELAAVRRLANFNETGDIVDDRDDLRVDVAANNIRDNEDADLVVLLTDGNYGNNTIFGIAYVLEAGNPAFAHCIVEADAASGRFTFTHELAHLFRCRHDQDGLGGNPLAVSFARGNVLNVNGVDERTIMALLPAGNARIQHFSNPNVNFNNVATGTATRDNARQLDVLAQTVTDYEDDDSRPVAARIVGTTSGNNSTIGFWEGFGGHCDNITNYRWETSTDGFSYTLVQNGPNADTYSAQLPQNNDLYLKLTLTTDLGRTGTAYLHVYNFDNQGCNPCPRVATTNSTVDMEVFPIPTKDRLRVNIAIEDESEVVITLYDLFGKQLRSITNQTLSAGQYSYETDMSSLPEGFYIVTTQTGKHTTSKKVLVQK